MVVATGSDGVLAGTDSFAITAGTASSVLVVNYTEFAQSNTGLDLSPSMTWNGTPLKQAINQISAATSNIYAEVFYLYDPAPAVNGNLVISGSGRTAAVGAYTLSGVNTTINPVTYGHDANANPSSVTLSGATPAGGFAAITGAFRENGNTTFTYTPSSGPAVNQQWTNSDASNPSRPPATCLRAVDTILNLSGGSVTVTQTDNGTSRNEIAAAVFAPFVPPASVWSSTGGGSWNNSSNWGGTVPTGTGAAAQFTASNPTTAAAVTLDAAITLNSLTFANSNQISLTPGNSGSLTFAANGATLPSITVSSGTTTISAPVSLNANTAFTVNSGQTLTVGANIANGTASSGISLAGGGTLALGGNNSYSGTTSVTGGVLNVTGNLGNTPISVSGGAMSLSGTLGNVPVSVSGAGALNVSGTLGNSPISVTGGTLSLQSPGAVNQNVVNLSGGALVETASNAMSGSAALTVNTGASATLSQANNYSGLTTVSGGLVASGHAHRALWRKHGQLDAGEYRCHRQQLAGGQYRRAQ